MKPNGYCNLIPAPRITLMEWYFAFAVDWGHFVSTSGDLWDDEKRYTKYSKSNVIQGM